MWGVVAFILVVALSSVAMRADAKQIFEDQYIVFSEDVADFYEKVYIVLKGGSFEMANLDVSGDVTADAFYGDGSGLTGLPGGDVSDEWVNETGDTMTGDLYLAFDLDNIGYMADGDDGAELDGVYDIYIVDNYAFMTTYGTSGLEIVDITDMGNPKHVAFLADGEGGAELTSPRDLVVDKGFAYIAVRNGYALEVVDVTNPSNPKHAYTYTPGSYYRFERIIKYNKYVIATASTVDEVVFFDVSDPYNVTIAYQLNDGVGGYQCDNPKDLQAFDQYLFVACQDVDSNLAIVNITDIENPMQITAFTDANITAGLITVEIDGSYAYTTAQAGGVFTIDISNITAPEVAGFYSTGSYVPTAIAVTSDYLMYYYMATIYVLDRSDPTNLTYIDNSGSLGGTFANIVIHGPYVLVPNYFLDRMHILRMTTIEAPAAVFGSLEVDQLRVHENLHASKTITANGIQLGYEGISTPGDVTARNITVDCIIFKSGGSVCSGS